MDRAFKDLTSRPILRRVVAFEPILLADEHLLGLLFSVLCCSDRVAAAPDRAASGIGSRSLLRSYLVIALCLHGLWMAEIVVISSFSLLLLLGVGLQASVLAVSILGCRSYSTVEQICAWLLELGLRLSVLGALGSNTSRMLHLVVCIDGDSA